MSSSATLILDKRTKMIGQISELSIVNSSPSDTASSPK
jgi:hypothetical protein